MHDGDGLDIVGLLPFYNGGDGQSEFIHFVTEGIGPIGFCHTGFGRGLSHHDNPYPVAHGKGHLALRTGKWPQYGHDLVIRGQLTDNSGGFGGLARRIIKHRFQGHAVHPTRCIDLLYGHVHGNEIPLAPVAPEPLQCKGHA